MRKLTLVRSIINSRNEIILSLEDQENGQVNLKSKIKFYNIYSVVPNDTNIKDERSSSYRVLVNKV